MKEYLLSSAFSSSEHDLTGGNKSSNHFVLAKVCLHYLCCSNLPANQEAGNTFREYAIENWLKHKEISGLDDLSFHRLLTKFLEERNANFNKWATIFESQQRTDEDVPYNDDSVPGPLYFAALLGLVPTIEILLERDASSIDNIGGVFGIALQVACAKGYDAAIAILLRSNADVKIKAGELGSAIGASAFHGRYSLVFELLGRGATVDEQDRRDRTPLYYAVMKGHLEITKLLLENGADPSIPDKNGWTPLNIASINGHFEIVRLLLDKGANIEVAVDGWTPLSSASYNGHLEIVRHLLGKGASLETSHIGGWMPVNAASDKGHLEVVKYLIQKGASLVTLDSTGQSPLFRAVRGGHLEL